MCTMKVMEVHHGKKKNTFQGRPFFPCCLRIELVASLHYTFSILQKIELKHPLSSETLLSLRSGPGMAMNNYARDGAPKWPHIFISAHGAQCRQKGSGSRGPSASTVMYHTALRVLTVQLGALLRPGPVSGRDQRRAGQDQERLPQIHFSSRGHQSP